MKLQLLFVFVLSVHLVLGKNTHSYDGVDEKPSKRDGCEYSTFKVTTRKRSFGDARTECRAMGGDLLTDNFGPEGYQYHSEIYKIAMQYTVENEMDGLWVGYTDQEHEGSWRFLSGHLYDANNRGQSAVAYWGNNEPSGIDWTGTRYENCGRIYRRWGPLELNDDVCEDEYYGLCEFKRYDC